MNINRADFNRSLVSGSRGHIVAPLRGSKRSTGPIATVKPTVQETPVVALQKSDSTVLDEPERKFISSDMSNPSLSVNKMPAPKTVADVVADSEITKDSKSIEIKAVDLPATAQTKPLAVIPVYEPFVPSQPKPISTPMPDILPSKPKDENGMTIDESQAQAVDKVELLNGVVKKTSEKHNFIKTFFKKLAIIVAVFAVIGLIGYYGYINLRIYI